MSTAKMNFLRMESSGIDLAVNSLSEEVKPLIRMMAADLKDGEAICIHVIKSSEVEIDRFMEQVKNENGSDGADESQDVAGAGGSAEEKIDSDAPKNVQATSPEHGEQRSDRVDTHGHGADEGAGEEGEQVDTSSGEETDPATGDADIEELDLDEDNDPLPDAGAKNG